jgi:NAD(P)-dependent dehydrogenase (short-subunit alcohol dehydrogenase family)
MGMNLKPLSQQVIVVFGASTGIGRVTALEACRRGARVVAAARGEDALDSLAAEAGAPDRFAVRVADAGHADEVRAVADAAVAQFGGLDTWAQVAGVAEHARFEDMPLDDFRRVIEVDLLGPVYGREVVVGGAGKAQLLVQRVSPRALDAFMRLAAFRLQMSGESKGAGDTDALDQPVAGDDRRRGVISNLRR